jgi:hypothetical protein
MWTVSKLKVTEEETEVQRSEATCSAYFYKAMAPLALEGRKARSQSALC